MATEKILSGKLGSITVPSAELETFSWTLNTGTELLDCTAFGNTYRKRVAGLKDLAGTASAFIKTGVANCNIYDLDGVSGSFVLTHDTGSTITFNGIIGRISVGVDVNGVQVVQFEFAHSDDNAPVVAFVEAS